MRTVMLGGAPGVGKTTVARHLLELAQEGPRLVQWVDVDSLWLHQPWRVDERMTAMVRANLRAVAAHARQARVDVLLITWVFQSTDIHRLVTGLLPAGTETVSVQLRAGRDTWLRRFGADPTRSAVNDFYESRYAAAQDTPADHVVDTDGATPAEVARRVAALTGITGREEPVTGGPGPGPHRT